MKKIILFLVLFQFTFSLYGQDKQTILKNNQALLDSANYLYKSKQYRLALTKYKSYNEIKLNDAFVLFRIGMCYLLGNYEQEKSMHYFQKIKPEKFQTENSLFYWGLSLQYHLNYSESILYFERFISQKNNSVLLKEEAKLRIEQCKYALSQKNNSSLYEVINLGGIINTAQDELAPQVLSDQSGIYFIRMDTLSGKSDLFFASYQDKQPNLIELKKQNFTFSSPFQLKSISVDGQQLFWNTQVNGQEEIFKSKLQDRDWLAPQLLYGQINSQWNETGICLSATGKTIYFSSDRAGGKGGFDIYTAQLQTDGSWSGITNLSLNSEYDEKNPFLHPNGKYLFFSANRKNSFGGFDLYRSEKMSETEWSEPVNLGPIVNTPYDETNISITADGETAIFSSNRAGGMGWNDLYRIKGKLVPENSFLLLRGKTSLDEASLQASITVMEENGKHVGSYFSNGTSGLYKIGFNTENTFRLIFSINGYAPKEFYLNTHGIFPFKDSILDIPFYSKEYLAQHPELDTSNQLVREIIRRKDARYFVQIGAYKKTEKVDFSSVKKFGKITTKNYGDGFTRYYIGKFYTLEEAKELQEKIKAEGIKDAFIAVELDGKREVYPELNR